MGAAGFRTQPGKFAAVGAVLGVVAAVALSWVAGLAFLALFVMLGVLWRRGEAPVLPLCLTYQWTSVMAGFLFMSVTGFYPGMRVGDIDKAVLLSLAGFVALTLGILAARAASGEPDPSRLPFQRTPYDVRRIFLWAVAGTLGLWFLDIRPMGIFFDGAQILYRVLEVMGLFGALLLFAVFEQRKGYGYAIAFVGVLFVTSLGSASSSFSSPLILLLLVLATEWSRWSRRASDRRRGRRMGMYAAVTAVTLGFAYLAWEGAIKAAWRPALLARGGGLSPLERIESFLGMAGDMVTNLSWTMALWPLAARASSGVGFFSHVVERVPEIVPHEGGELSLRALEHIAMPRLFFPGKANLGSDSWLIHQYAGLPAAGAEQGTSVGLGYMAEFYIDFGDVGMFVPIVAYGVVIGLLYELIRRAAPSRLFFMSGVSVVFLHHFMAYEGEIAKLLGGLIQSGVAMALVLAIAGPRLHRSLQVPEPVDVAVHEPAPGALVAWPVPAGARAGE